MDKLQRNTTQKKSVRIGRGGARGKTAGRGHKGQKAHGGHGIRPDMRDTIKKFPKMRGRGKNLHTPVNRITTRNVSIEKLDANFESGATITPAVLVEQGIIRRDDGKLPAVKILSDGDTKKKFTIEGCSASATAKEKLEKAGSSIK